VSLAEITLAVAAGLALVWVLLPSCVYALRLTEVQSRVWDDPARAEPTGADADYARRFAEFTALGFRPVGATFESAWFFNPLHWRWRGTEPERWLAHPSGHTFASFHRLMPTEPLRFSVVTFLETGGRVRTTCPGTGFPSPAQPGSLVTELTQVEPAGLWAAHQKLADEYCASGDLSPKPLTFPEAIRAALALDRRLLRSLDQSNTRAFIFLSFVLPSLLAAVVLGFVRHGLGWRAAALGVCAGGLVWAWQRHVVFPAALRDAKLRSHGGRDA
jgi:hypothetical protein